MEGQVKVIEGVYPVTRAEAVYVSDEKTLKEAIDDGTIGAGGTEVTLDGRPHINLSLRGGIINVRRESGNVLHYTFPPLDHDRYRRLFVWTGSGAKRAIEIPDGVLQPDEALVYNVTSNTVDTRHGAWGNIDVNANEYLLLYNNLGILGGLLSKYVSMGGDSLSIPVRYVDGEQISPVGSTQGIFIVDGNVYRTSHSNDEHTNYATIVSDGFSMTHNFGHMNAPSYSHSKDSLIVGNGSSSYSLPMKGWIIPNFASLLVHNSVLEFDTTPKVELDFTHIVDDFKCQLCWGYDGTDIVWMFSYDNRIIRKLILGKGDNNLGTGVFISGTPANEYNGSYEIVGEWRSRSSDVLGGMVFHKGYIYTGVKGEYGVRKSILLNNGSFDSEYIVTENLYGDMQGLAVYEDDLYAYTDYRGYKIDASYL